MHEEFERDVFEFILLGCMKSSTVLYESHQDLFEFLSM